MLALPNRVREPHLRAIERLEARYGADPAVLALVVIGSVARGEAGPRSDVDCVLVLSEDERARREARGEVGIDADDHGEGTHVGGEFVDMQQLHETQGVARSQRASPSPTRSSCSRACQRLRQ